ncbi:MAG: hypothetical protein ACI4DN_03490 [Lachnospiraceae bacterium]
MKIEEARGLYNLQIKEYREQRAALIKQKTVLERKMDSVLDGSLSYANEAAVLELTLKTIEEKKNEYSDYMEKLMQQWSAVADRESAKQQGEAMEKYVEDMGKLMEVARRLMKGGIVPASDEKKLMEYSMELYQMAKNMGTLAKQREEYDSLWKEEKKSEYVDPIDTANNTEAFADGPPIVDVADIMADIASGE